MRRGDVTLPSGLRLATWDVRPSGPPGAPFLLVHGLSSNARLWDVVAGTLAEHGHRTVTVDLRGHGRSDKPDEGYDVPTVADDLRGVIEAVDLGRPVAVGQSWGGNVVLELAASWPEGLRGIACVDGGTIDLRERFGEWPAAESALAPPRFDGMGHEDFVAHLRRAHPDWPERGLQATLENVELRGDGTVAPWLTFDRHLEVLRGLWEHRPSSRFPDVRVPVLLVPAHDDDDPRRDADRWRTIDAARAAIPTARVCWMRGEHDLHAQHPERLAGVLHDATEDLFLP